MGNELIPFADVERMAVTIAKSGFFGVKTAEQAAALMLIAQAEGRHPASAAQDYHIIQNRPALKADAMLARFQTAGGVVEWVELTDAKVAAKFHHPHSCPKPVLVEWDMKRAATAGLGGKDGWKKYPRQMLRARVISEGVRTCYPSVIAGFYTPEEVQEFGSEITNCAIPVKAEVKDSPKPPEPKARPDTFGASTAFTGGAAPLPDPEAIAPTAEHQAAVDALAAATPAVPVANPDAEPISEKQVKRMFALARGAGKSTDDIKRILGEYGYQHSRDVKRVAYDEICARLEAPAGGAK